jgi:apolipoprotein N-acyltransferase
VPRAAGVGGSVDLARAADRAGAGLLPALASAALGGIFYFLGYVGFGIWPLIFVFLVPLWSALERVRERRWTASALIGLVFGCAAYAGGFGWLWRIVDVFLAGNVALGAALWTAYGAWFALAFVVYALLFRAIRNRGRGIWLAGVPPLVAVEALQPHLFPVNAGAALIHALPLAQIADLGGPLLLTVEVASFNVVAFLTWRWWRSGSALARPVAAWGFGIALLAGVLVYGWVRVAQVERAIAAAPSLTIGIVQANLGLMEKREQAEVSHRRHLEMTRELLREGPVDLVVWPETVYVRGIRRPLPVSGRFVLDDLQVPLLFGGTSVHEEDGRRVKSNSAFLIGADGMIRDAYDKNLLIPLAEYAPFAEWLPGIAEWFPHVQEFRGSSEVTPLRLGPWRIVTPICYEAVRPELVRRMVRDGDANLIVTLANDAWFGDSQEPWLHMHLARLRAIELGRFVVRSTNSGVSGLIDPVGRLAPLLDQGTTGRLRVVARLLGDGE